MNRIDLPPLEAELNSLPTSAATKARCRSYYKQLLKADLNGQGSEIRGRINSLVWHANQLEVLELWGKPDLSRRQRKKLGETIRCRKLNHAMSASQAPLMVHRINMKRSPYSNIKEVVVASTDYLNGDNILQQRRAKRSMLRTIWKLLLFTRVHYPDGSVYDENEMR